MIHRLNEQVLSSDNDGELKEARKRPSVVPKLQSPKKESQATSTLRSIVEEVENTKVPTKVTDTSQASEEQVDDDEDDDSDDCDATSEETTSKRLSHFRNCATSPAKKQRMI